MTFYATMNDGASAFTVDADTREQAAAQVQVDLRGEDPARLAKLVVLTSAEWNRIGTRARNATEFRKLLAEVEGARAG